MTNSPTANIESLISRHQDGFSLAQEFYCDEDLFYQDIHEVLANGWLLVDHASRIPENGDYFLFQIGREEIIVVRENSNTVNAFFNVCRHRGSRVCLERHGNKKVFTCPYHAWSYELNGTLRGAREMDEGFDKNDFGLNHCHIRVFCGFIFISLKADSAPDFDNEYKDFTRVLDFQGIADARIAIKRDYPTNANWKLVVENFIECYHCAPAHPEYSRVHPPQQLAAIGAGPGSGPPDAVEKYQRTLDDWRSQVSGLGHPIDEINFDEHTQSMGQIMRFPINDRGFKSETHDGEFASKKMLGNITQPDFGETAIAFSPTSYLLAFNDFAVMFRFTPLSVRKTDVQVTWLVSSNAREGVDYDLDNLIFLWDVTTKQDKQITENNQLGVASSRYRPGPYSRSELRVATFTRWYLNKLSAVAQANP